MRAHTVAGKRPRKNTSAKNKDRRSTVAIQHYRVMSNVVQQIFGQLPQNIPVIILGIIFEGILNIIFEGILNIIPREINNKRDENPYVHDERAHIGTPPREGFRTFIRGYMVFRSVRRLDRPHVLVIRVSRFLCHYSAAMRSSARRIKSSRSCCPRSEGMPYSVTLEAVTPAVRIVRRTR